MIGRLKALLGRARVRWSQPAPAPAVFAEAAPADITRLLRLEDRDGAALERTRSRLAVIGLAVGLGFCVMGARAVQLSLFADEEPTAAYVAEAAPGVRRELADRDGDILATNLQFQSLWADPRMVVNPRATAERLAAILPDLDVERTTRLLSRNGEFVWIRRQLLPRQHTAVMMAGLPGLKFRAEPGRVYPRARTAAHVIGYTDTDLNGISGAELAFNAALADGPGRPEPLSLDLTAQFAVETVLRERMARYGAQGAAAVLMKVGTGEVLALASLPDFDPNRRADAKPEELFNRATTGVYELGSVFKPLALAAAIDAGTATLATEYDATRPIRVGGHTISDYEAENRVLTAREMIIHSSNIAAARMADELGAERLRAFYDRLHLFEPAPIELAESGTPLEPRRWGRAETMTVSYGHGVAVSPLSLTAAYAALANGGVYVAPTLRVAAPGERIAGEPVMSPSAAAQVLIAMRQAVTHSTIASADVPGFAVAGKTGTAEAARGGGYSESGRITSFVAIFPFDDPEYVLTVMLENPTTNPDHPFGRLTGGWLARPTAAEMIERLAPILGVRPREAEPGARASTVASMFAPRVQVRPDPEEPLPETALRPAPARETGR